MIKEMYKGKSRVLGGQRPVPKLELVQETRLEVNAPARPWGWVATVVAFVLVVATLLFALTVVVQ